jgi:hypothetical protein
MPSRLIRDWTGSDKVNGLSVHAERFFTRLIMKADDYGRFYADTRLLKANLFPLLLDNIREADMLRWMAECQKAGLIVLYEVSGKKYLRIDNYGQRLRQKTKKFPSAEGEVDENQPDDAVKCQQIDSNLSASGQQHAARSRSRREEKRSISSSAASPENLQVSIHAKKEELYQQLTPFVEKHGKEMIRAFYDYWTEPNKTGTRIRMDMEKTWDLAKRVQRWSDNQDKFGSKQSAQPKNSLVV